MSGDLPHPAYIPRIRANAVQFGAQWGFEMFITHGPSDPITMVFDKDPYLFLNKESALVALKRECANVMDLICAEIGLKPDGLIDLNRGEMHSVESYKNAKLESRS